MNNNYIVSEVNRHIEELNLLIKNEQDNKRKIYYYQTLSSLQRIKYAYTKKAFMMIYPNSDIKKGIEQFLFDRNLMVVDTIENSMPFIKVITETLLEYICETSSCWEENNNKLINESNFTSFLLELFRQEGLEKIYKDNKHKEIMDFNNPNNPGEKTYAASYNLLSTKGEYLIIIKEKYKNLNSLLNYSHEYGHFLSDYLNSFDLEKKCLKNQAYNEIMSEILRIKLKSILADNNYMSYDRAKQEEVSFVRDMIVLYIYSHYEIIGVNNPETVIKEAIADIKMKYQKLKINITDISYDDVIHSYIYAFAKYIGNLYSINNINVLESKSITSQNSDNPLLALNNIGLFSDNFMNPSIIKNNLSKILIRK